MKNPNDKKTTKDDTVKHLSNILNKLIKESGFDGVTLSKHTGVPVTTINRLRKYHPSNNPTLHTLLPLAEFFSISVSQLIGDTSLPKTHSHRYIANKSLSYLPVISWEEAISWPLINRQSHESITTEGLYSKKAYALIVELEEWENLVKGTALLIDPAYKAEHRDLIIVYKKGLKRPTIKQFLFDEDKTYLKPLTAGYHMNTMSADHKILGVVVEYKKYLKKSIKPVYK